MRLPLRWLGFGLGSIALLLALFAAFAAPGAGSGPTAATYVLAPDAFGSAASVVTLEGDVLRARGSDAGGSARVVQPTPGLDATRFRYFSYDIGAAPASMKQVLSWQGAKGQGAALLPPMPRGRGTIDLARVEAWSGPIDWVAISAMPVDYLAAAAVPDAELQLRHAVFETQDRPTAWAALATDWLAQRPWTGRSTNTGGFELGARPGPSLQVYVALAAAFCLVLALACFGRARLGRAALRILVAAAGVLAVWQLQQLVGRASAARAAAALADAHPVPVLGAQPAFALAADALSRQIDASASRPRLLVHGGNGFATEYATWLLRRHDAAPLQDAAQLPAQDALAGVALVLVGGGDWQFDPSSGLLRLGSHRRRAELLASAGPLQAYRILSSDAAR